MGWQQERWDAKRRVYIMWDDEPAHAGSRECRATGTDGIVHTIHQHTTCSAYQVANGPYTQGFRHYTVDDRSTLHDTFDSAVRAAMGEQ